jgi:hypothetical protein
VVGLNEELAFQARHEAKINDLEEKIELLLEQNNHFVDENEKLILLVQEKNQEIDILRHRNVALSDTSHLS